MALNKSMKSKIREFREMVCAAIDDEVHGDDRMAEHVLSNARVKVKVEIDLSGLCDRAIMNADRTAFDDVLKIKFHWSAAWSASA